MLKLVYWKESGAIEKLSASFFVLVQAPLGQSGWLEEAPLSSNCSIKPVPKERIPALWDSRKLVHCEIYCRNGGSNEVHLPPGLACACQHGWSGKGWWGKRMWKIYSRQWGYETCSLCNCGTRCERSCSWQLLPTGEDHRPNPGLSMCSHAF